MEKKLFIFDMGGVMCTNTNVIDDICEKLGLTQRAFFNNISADNLRGIKTGKLSMKEFWHRFSANSGIAVDKDYFKSFFSPRRNQCMYSIVNELKRNNRVVAGTNTIEPHYQKHLENGDYDIFDKVYPSNTLGISKPDTGFYKEILKSEEVEPRKTVFIDDRAENLKTAEVLGIHSILFTSCDDLREKIRIFF